MNQNIEVINKNLWAVNQEYVRQGFIKELSILPGSNPESKDASLSNDGKLILNKSSPMYDTLSKFVPRVMDMADDILQDTYEKMKKIQTPDNYEKLYLSVLGWEIKRRHVRAEYLDSLHKANYKDRLKNIIINWIRRKVNQYVINKNGN
ncbi:hypothetical protein acsn021_04100 [Anaerocolumna cellulosilytica]|uniref:Uncharacterized protein n=1 Tax=Anaerocolumna cellulosilytica TaxID=433286 RepID=A0A6S6R0S7_9FIRM|nr:hypothetical protein [Anaerocolumna cellulosilytica]MBB5197398.1 putative P-loop ATPase/GTPase [Anaerocolumna cellulosilytica]BCJ92841.1 hypothetical protein acsn021_04100 [Anaerocolumna cellulosilytica]